MKLYHATYGVYLDSIMEKGLIPNYYKNWDFSSKYIYLTDDPGIAQDFAETADMAPEEYLSDIVILEVDLESLDQNKLRIDDNITQDENEEDEPYSFQYAGKIAPELITVYDRIKNPDIKKPFDKALVNYYDNMGLAEELDKVIKEYREENDIDICRGQCYNEADNFVFWLQDNKQEVFANLQSMGIQRVDGKFEVDYPEKLPLDSSDLRSAEWKDFLDKYEDVLWDEDIAPDNGSHDTMMRLSEYIWEWAKNNVDDLSDFYLMPHSWVAIDNYFIIDFTWEQFKEAIYSTANLVDRYNY